MGLPAIIAVVIIVTGVSVFSAYKIFIEKNAPEPSPSPSPIVESSSAPEILFSPQSSPSQTSYPVIKPSVSPARTGSSVISGTIYMNGSAPSGTSIVIVQRPHGTNNLSQVVVGGVTAQNGATWSWNGAQKGVEYDMVAVLKGQSSGQNIDYAQSLSYNLTAPTSGFMMTVNVGYIMPAPTGTITITCNTHYSNNTWYATVNFPLVSNALQYWLQVGSTSGGTDIANIPKNAQTQDVTINDSQQYFAQYAVSPVSNPTQYQYSAFSTPAQIHCP